MIRIITSILAYLWIASVISKAGAEYKCISSNNEPVKLSISNRRNQTGHLITQVEFEHRSAPGVKGTDLWRVDVEERTRSCEGVEYISYLKFTISAPFRPPTSDYELFPGVGYYKFHDDAVKWPRAREICAEEGAHLVIINSEKESDVTKTLFARFPKITGASTHYWSWVGIREVEGVNGQYVTIHGVPYNDTGFTRWHPGQPNANGSTGDYILVHRSTGGLGDIPSSVGWSLAFICEQEL